MPFPKKPLNHESFDSNLKMHVTKNTSVYTYYVPTLADNYTNKKVNICWLMMVMNEQMKRSTCRSTIYCVMNMNDKF